MRNIFVTGATGQIGTLLLPLLVEQQHACLCVSRETHEDGAGIHWIKADMNMEMSTVWRDCDAQVWIHLGFLPLAIPHFKAAFDAGIKRFVAFSSTSVFTKKESESAQEQQTIQRLIEAEANMILTCQKYAVAWTLFRPTMIYGCGMDQNIAFIQKTIKQFGLFPVAGSGKGLRQPVHVEDLALACIESLKQKQCENRAYNLSGSEVLSYRDMVTRIFHALSCQPRIIQIPAPMYKLAIVLLKHLSSRYAFVQPSMVDRMSMNMVFDHADATHDFDYRPKGFQP